MLRLDPETGKQKWYTTDGAKSVLSAIISILIGMAVGMLMMFFSRSFIITTISGVVMMTGYLISTSVLSSLVRDYTPRGKEGEIQGVRMIFQVMIPMIIGPFLGSSIIKGSNLTYIELGVVKSVPTPNVFLLASVITLFSLLPLIVLKRSEVKR